MSKLTIELDLDNEAMQDSREIARVLENIKEDILKEAFDEYFTYKTYRDINGNTIGFASFELDEEEAAEIPQFKGTHDQLDNLTIKE